MRRLLLGQLDSNGDCLYATILARQIRHDFPDAHLTWAISSLCSGLLRNNPHVDEVWEVPVPTWEDREVMWRVFEREAARRVLRHEFDHAWLSQIWPDNFQNYDGTIRPSILRSYGAPITVPIENVIELDADERARVEAFVREARLDAFEHRILFECSSKSGQSFVTPELAQEVAAGVQAALPGATFVFSTHEPMVLRHPSWRWAGGLSLREIAGLTHACTLFMGSGSGATVAATSSAARALPMLQLLSAGTSMYASFAHDFAHFGLPAGHILEMTREDPAAIAGAVVLACREGIAAARQRHGEALPLHFRHYRGLIRHHLLDAGRFLDAARSLATTAARYGWLPELREFGARQIAPRLAEDLGWIHPHRRRAGEAFLQSLHQAGGV